jgi:hypothetical protein
MPVQQSQGHAGKALAVASVGVLFALGLALAVSVLASRGKIEVRLGDQEFKAGQTANIAAEIEQHGPVFYRDPVSGGRPIFIQHLGTEVDAGWFAFSAFAPGPDDCLVEWDAGDEVFRSQCDANDTVPADGDGLRQYPVTVEQGRLYVDLNPDDDTTTTTT